MNKRHNFRVLGLTVLTLSGLSLAHSVDEGKLVDREKAAAETAQAGKALEGNPQMTIPVTKAEKMKEMSAQERKEMRAQERKEMRAKKAERREMRAEKKAKEEEMAAKRAAERKSEEKIVYHEVIKN